MTRMTIMDGLAYIGESIYWKKRSHSVNDLLLRMEENGIDMSVITAPRPGPRYDQGNELVYDAVEQYPDKFIGVYKVNPLLGEAEITKAEDSIKDWGFKGFRVDPRDDGCGMWEPTLRKLMEVASRLAVPVYLQTGGSDFCRPEEIINTALAYPQTKIIMGTSQYAIQLAANPKLADDLKNVYFFTHQLAAGPGGVSFLLGALGRKGVIGAERIVFTTETPFGHPELELKIIELSKLDETMRELILGGNLRKIMGI